MVNVVSTRCDVDGCDKSPTFGLAGDRIASRCAAHKAPDMVNVRDKRCNGAGGCDKRPTYGLVGAPASRCASHKAPDMVNVKNAKRTAAKTSRSTAKAAACIDRYVHRSAAGAEDL